MKKIFENLQANILKPHGREHVWCLFVQLYNNRPIMVRKWLSKFAEQITTAEKQLEDNQKRREQKNHKRYYDGGTVTTFFLSAEGFHKLGFKTYMEPKTTIEKLYLMLSDKREENSYYNTIKEMTAPELHFEIKSTIEESFLNGRINSNSRTELIFLIPKKEEESREVFLEWLESEKENIFKILIGDNIFINNTYEMLISKELNEGKFEDYLTKAIKLRHPELTALSDDIRKWVKDQEQIAILSDAFSENNSFSDRILNEQSREMILEIFHNNELDIDSKKNEILDILLKDPEFLKINILSKYNKQDFYTILRNLNGNENYDKTTDKIIKSLKKDEQLKKWIVNEICKKENDKKRENRANKIEQYLEGLQPDNTKEKLKSLLELNSPTLSTPPKNKTEQSLIDQLPKSESFKKGMKHMTISKKLDDPYYRYWEDNYRHSLDALIILADDSEKTLEAREKELIEQLKVSNIGRHIFTEKGHIIRKDGEGPAREHFGYADGISQPTILSKKDDSIKKLKFDNFNIDENNLVTVAEKDNAFGSYLVYRKIEQNVKAFNDKVHDLAQKLNISPELAGAQAIGRFKNGLPLTISEKTDGANKFNFKEIDADDKGQRCPFHAHIRKVRPRGDAETNTGFDKRSIFRQGITYGARKSDLSDEPQKDVGVLFMSYQASIENQFEFLQRERCNNPNSHDPNVKNPIGIDPLIGQKTHPITRQPDTSAAELKQRWNKRWNDLDEERNKDENNRKLFNGATYLKGGEYFYAPSIAFLKGLQPKRIERADKENIPKDKNNQPENHDNPKVVNTESIAKHEHLSSGENQNFHPFNNLLKSARMWISSISGTKKAS